MARRIRTTETSFDIIDYIKENDGATMSELGHELDLANSTVHGHLKTLEQKGLLVKEGNVYHLGLRFFHYGEVAKRRKPEYEYAKDVTTRIANQSGEGANFCVPENDKVIVLFGESIPEDPVYDIGNIFYMHLTAVGKAVLAEYSDERVSAVVDRFGLPARTEQTITDESRLRTELEAIRERGYAYNREELLPGLNAVGTVVKGPDESIVGAFSIGGPSYRNVGNRLESELPEILLNAKESFETDIRSIYTPG